MCGTQTALLTVVAMHQVLDDAMRSLKTRSSPYALLVKKRTFDSYTLQTKMTSPCVSCRA